MSDGVDTTNLNKLQKAMNSLAGAALVKFKGRTTYLVAEAIRGIIAAYPGPVKYTHSRKDGTKGVTWPSDGARKAYFAERTKRGLPMKYTRGRDPMSQRVQQSWSVRRGSESATLGNTATYAPYVASDQYQTEQHEATGFTTDKEAAEKVLSGGAMGRIVTASIRQMMDDAFKGV